MKKTCPTLEDRVETSNLQIHSFSSSLQSCMWAWKTLPKKAAVICCKKKKNPKMTVETVETVVAAAPYAALIGHKLRPLLSDSQSALGDCEEDVIQIWHLLSRYGKLFLVRLTKSFPTIPNLRGIANANQNDERFKMWSVMLLCTIEVLSCRAFFFSSCLCSWWLTTIAVEKRKKKLRGVHSEHCKWTKWTY